MQFQCDPVEAEVRATSKRWRRAVSGANKGPGLAAHRTAERSETYAGDIPAWVERVRLAVDTAGFIHVRAGARRVDASWRRGAEWGEIEVRVDEVDDGQVRLTACTTVDAHRMAASVRRPERHLLARFFSALRGTVS